MNNIVRIILTGIFLLLTAGCSTKKNTVVTRNYHNLTSQYNIYFNATESYRAGLQKVENNFKDDYNNLLPLFTFSSKEAARSMLPDMDKAYKKCSKLITMHSLKVRPKPPKRGINTEKQKKFYRKNEYNRWVDDAFLLMGKAYFMKHDFFPAIENLQFVIREYPEDGLKDEASLWLARCHIELGNKDEATAIVNRLEGQPDFNKELLPDLLASIADLHIRNEDWAVAAGYLARAAESYNDKKQRTRIWFVLAQIYEKLDELTLASQAFGEVIDLNPRYEMSFSAKINRARLYEGDPEAGAEIRKELLKMLKDDKNIEYLDQVYYAIAELDMKEGLVDEAIVNYRKSIWNSTDNTTQKAISYLALGKHYHKKKDYIPAAAYYDSCSQFLPEAFLGYAGIIALTDDLRILGDNLKIIAREDSLQAVARMPEAERNELIAKKMEEAKEAEEEAKRLEEEELLNMQAGRGGRGGGGTRMQGSQSMGMQGGSMGGRGGIQGGTQLSGMEGMNESFGGASGWYFYNPSTLAFGQSEFIKMWGRRKLEDNWRRSNKRIASMAEDMSGEGESGEIETPMATSKAAQFSPTSREYYLADLPLSDTLVNESNSRIHAALLNVGKVFKDEFNNADEAIPPLVELIERKPGSDKLLPAYYNLYDIYNRMKPDAAEADRYKQLIVDLFPESRSAQIISNPNYFKELDEERVAVMNFYNQTYESWKSGAWQTVIDNSARADTAFKVNPIRDKFALLHAMAYAQVFPEDTTGLKAQLNDLVFKFPESETVEPAKNLLAYIESGPQSKSTIGGKQLQVGRVQRPVDQGPVTYDFKPTQVHYYVSVVSARSMDINRLKFRVSDFNVENYDQDFFEVSSVPLNEDLQILVVKNFEDQKAGMDYYRAIEASPDVYVDFNQLDYRHFIISKENYNLFFQNKNVFQYIQFFRENYLKD